MAHDLGFPVIADGQADDQWQTSNDADSGIGNALADILLVDFSAGNVSLNATQYRSAMVFKPSAALAAARTLTLPSVKRPFIFHNTDATYTVTLKSTDGASPEVATTIVVSAGKTFVGYTNGSSPGLFGAVIADATAVGDVVGPGSAVDSRLAAFDGTTGKLIKDGGVAVSIDGTFASNSDAKLPTEKAAKTYIDGLALNLGKRGRVRAATTANITIATALNNGDTLDGITLATGDLVLVKDQSAPEGNGIYVVGVSPARSSEFDTYNEHPGALLAVAEGTANADTLWLCTSNDGGTLNTTAIAFSQIVISGAVGTSRQIISGGGLTGGGDLSVDRTLVVGAGTGITVNADDVQIAAAYQAIGKQTVFIPASAMTAATTNGPATGQVETASNKVNFSVLDFDATTAEQAWFDIAMPKGWDEGTVTFQAWWTTSATDTDGVAISLAGVALSDNEALDTAVGTPVVVTDDAQSAALELLVTAESSAVTIAGTPAEGDLCLFRVQRVVSDGNDDMSEDMRLIGIKLFFTLNAANDA